jgi:hypothetical protein
VKLHESMPPGEDTGDFAFIRLSVEEMFKDAKAWQEEVSNLTLLSLRGGKRRAGTGTSPVRGLGDESKSEDSGPSMIDVRKVEELSNHPILSKVGIFLCVLSTVLGRRCGR